ncbi:MAG: DUF255 domain-containing protein, partial [Thermoanaerobaculia bacterium]|nr:DUF255 domain-containing protein [Thermoanaerobaculia bacterium]
MRFTDSKLLLVALMIAPLSGAETSRENEPNRLIHENSPYLLQHAYTPVDWYPWGEEAFEKARAEEKPIFLSIGYSTCHWCHVMERETFSDPEIAKMLNEHFIPIKVDREERPDVDGLYLAFLSATSGDSGWPANIFLTPELKPFFGGTYFPPQDRDGRIGFESLIRRLASSWEYHRDQIEATGSQMISALKTLAVPQSSEETPGASVLDMTFEQIASRYEPEFGGFSPAPKFPQPVIHEFLLRHHVRERNQKAA